MILYFSESIAGPITGAAQDADQKAFGPGQRQARC